MFLASRIRLLIFAVIAALVGVELFVFGAATVGAALSGHGASLADYVPLAGSLLIAVLVAVALKYVFRPPAIRRRYWIVFVAVPVTVLLGVSLLFSSTPEKRDPRHCKRPASHYTARRDEKSCRRACVSADFDVVVCR